jgi:hypothetical protein
MGHDGGSYILVFDNKNDAKEFIETEKMQNTNNVRNYKNDETDSGRGDAAENGGGFQRFKVVQDSRIFSSEKEAEKVLSEKAWELDFKDDSIVYVVGEFVVGEFEQDNEVISINEPEGDCKKTGTPLKRERVKETKALNELEETKALNELKKRKTEPDSETTTTTTTRTTTTRTTTSTKVMVAISWTGAHY